MRLGSRGYREGDNPARWRGHLANLLARPAKKVQGEHHNALAYAALPAFMAELRTKDGMPAREVRSEARCSLCALIRFSACPRAQ